MLVFYFQWAQRMDTIVKFDQDLGVSSELVVG
jgi:hypothetical protein